MNTTIEIWGAKLSVPTEDLFRAWMRERVVVQAIPGRVPVLQQPHLDDGEIYLGAFYSADGSHQHHTILLPFDRKKAAWSDQMAWAKGDGFDLPNRLELLMMWMTMRDRFEKTGYWSCDVHDNSDYAWYQNFNSGNQTNNLKSEALRAVAVRRITIEASA